MDIMNLEIKLTKTFYHTPVRYLYKAFAKRIPIKGNEIILDFGSGLGTVAYFVARRLRTGQLFCADISEKWQLNCKKQLRGFDNVYYHCGSIEEIDVSNDYFDIIYCHFVLHDLYQEDLETAIASMYLLLKKGGLLIVREPCEEVGLKPMLTIVEQQMFRLKKKQAVFIPLIGKCMDIWWVK